MTQTAASSPSFETAIAELEGIVRAMESGQITLEQALEHYQRGVGLLRHCQQTLQEAEQRILQLEGDELVPAAGRDENKTP